MPDYSSGWDQVSGALDTFKQGLFPDRMRQAQAGYYGAQTRKSMIESDQLAQKQLRQQQLSAIIAGQPIDSVPVQTQPGTAPNTPSYQSAAPAPVTPAPAAPATPGDTVQTPPAAPAAPPVTPMPLTLPPPPASLAEALTPKPGGGGASPVPGMHPASVTSPDGGVKQSPPAQLNGSPAPPAFNLGQVVSVATAAGYDAQTVDQIARTYIESAVRSGVLDRVTGMNLLANHGATGQLQANTQIQMKASELAWERDKFGREVLNMTDGQNNPVTVTRQQYEAAPAGTYKPYDADLIRQQKLPRNYVGPGNVPYSSTAERQATQPQGPGQPGGAPLLTSELNAANVRQNYVYSDGRVVPMTPAEFANIPAGQEKPSILDAANNENYKYTTTPQAFTDKNNQSVVRLPGQAVTALQADPNALRPYNATVDTAQQTPDTYIDAETGNLLTMTPAQAQANPAGKFTKVDPTTAQNLRARITVADPDHPGKFISVTGLEAIQRRLPDLPQSLEQVKARYQEAITQAGIKGAPPGQTTAQTITQAVQQAQAGVSEPAKAADAGESYKESTTILDNETANLFPPVQGKWGENALPATLPPEARTAAVARLAEILKSGPPELRNNKVAAARKVLTDMQASGEIPTTLDRTNTWAQRHLTSDPRVVTTTNPRGEKEDRFLIPYDASKARAPGSPTAPAPPLADTIAPPPPGSTMTARPLPTVNLGGNGGPPASAPTQPQQTATDLPQGALGRAPQGTPDGALGTARDGTPVIARGGFVYPAPQQQTAR